MVYNIINNLSYQPYRLVTVSLMSFIFWFIFIFIYTKVYPKKNIPYPILLLGFAVLPIISIFRQGIYESGDFIFHAMRTSFVYDSLKEGVLIPRWVENTRYHYGFAEFNYIHPFPYYISAFFHFLGFSIINSTKLLLASTYILSGFTMFYWLKQHTKSRCAFLGSILYLFTPYHLVDLHFRAHAGEVTAFMFIPLTFLFLNKTIKEKTFLWIFLTGISIALLILSHPALALITLMTLSLYAFLIIDFSNIKKVLRIVVGFALGLALSAYYWIPFMLEKRKLSQPLKEVTLEFPKFTELLYSKWRYGLLFQGPQGEHATLLGYAHVIIIVISIYLLIKGYRDRKFIFFLSISFLLIFLLQEISRPIWNNVSLLKSMIITYRVLAVVAFTTSTLAALALRKISFQRSLYLIIFIAIFSTILNWGNRGTIPDFNDQKLLQYVPNPDLLYSGDIEKLKSELPVKPIESLDGRLEIISERRNITRHDYVIQMRESGLVQENTNYFPGWKLYVNGKRTEILYDMDDLPNPMRFYLDEGKHRVKFIFTDTPVRFYSNLLSAVTLGLSGIYLIYDSFKSSSK